MAVASDTEAGSQYVGKYNSAAQVTHFSYQGYCIKFTRGYVLSRNCLNPAIVIALLTGLVLSAAGLDTTECFGRTVAEF